MCVRALPPPPLPPARPRRACARGRECACARFPRPLRALCTHAEFLPHRLLPQVGAGPGAGRCALMQVMFPAGSAAAGSSAKASDDGWPVCWWGSMSLALWGDFGFFVLWERGIFHFKEQSGQKYFMEFFNTEFKKQILLDTHTVQARRA